METSFYFRVKDYRVFTQRQFFGPDATIYEELIEDRHRIYFIVKTPRSRFLATSFYTTFPYLLKGRISVAGREHEVAFDVANLYYSNPNLGPMFTDRHDLVETIMRETYGHGNSTFNSLERLYHKNTMIDLGASTDDTLRVLDGLGFAISEYDGHHLEIPLYQAINQLMLEPPPARNRLYWQERRY